MSNQETLAVRCGQVASLAQDVIGWISDEENAEMVAGQKKTLLRSLRKTTRRAQKLTKSARTKMSVSVFGPSQAGKSFLVSVLARPEGGRLVADFPGPGGQLDYISEINPIGEGESTGLVTRFTMTKDACPDGFPIRLVLLSEADIIRTIVNSFFMDGDQSEPSPELEDVTAQIEAFKSKARGELPGLTFEEVLEIADYVNGSFGKLAYASALRSFWEEASEIAPGLAVRDRGNFLSILWGRHEKLTSLYVKLAEGLQQLQNAESVHAPLAALTPRETSIIDVKALKGLFSGGDDQLTLRLPAGSTVSLSRAVVCALAAELVMPMVTQPSDVFAQTDLLDFPGARNRFKKPLKLLLEDEDESLPGLFLRGKVAYLFDRYVENQEITSMLLCVPDSNMETVDLPGLVDNWIGLTHGTSPEHRARTNCILFLVLTKFDKHLGESAAGGGDEVRFQRRIEASLLEKFGKGEDNWVSEWTPNQPFDNCYWLRNPNYFVDGLIDYDAEQLELRIREDKVARVAELKAGCLSAPNVQRHINNPEVAWEAALKLNDGGVGYLIDQLRIVCTPDSKVRQISSQVEKLATDMHGEIRQFYVSDDIEKRIEEKKEAATKVIDGLEISLQRHRFGAFLNAIMVDQDAVRDRIARVPSSIRITNAVSTASPKRVSPTAASVTAGVVRPTRPGRPASLEATEANTTEGVEEPVTNIRTMSLETYQAETSIEVWMDGLKRFRDDLETVQRFGLAEENISSVNAELAHAIRRLGIVEAIKGQLSKTNFGLSFEKQAEPAAIVCADQINRFVADLGVSVIPENIRPKVDLGDGQKRSVFAARPSAQHAFDLPETGRTTAEDYWTDWVFSLDALYEANARDVGKGNVNRDQNMRIGKIIKELGVGGRQS